MILESNTKKYRQAIKELENKHNGKCEICGESAKHPHHIIPTSRTGINSELVYMIENMMLLVMTAMLCSIWAQETGIWY